MFMSAVMATVRVCKLTCDIIFGTENRFLGFVVSVCPSVRLSAWNNSAPTKQIFMKFDI